jgi:hypothetical protein
VTKNELKGKDKQKFIAYAKELSQDLIQTIQNKPVPLNITKFESYTALNSEV